MSDYHQAGCWQCMMRHWAGLLFHVSFRYCDPCLQRFRTAHRAWDEWSKG